MPPLPASPAAPAFAHEEPSQAPPSPPDASELPPSASPDDEQAEAAAPAAKNAKQKIAQDPVRIISSPSDSMSGRD